MFIGFTFLVAAVFPVGGQVAQQAAAGVLGSLLGSAPPALSQLLKLLLAYAPAAAVTAWFFNAAQLRERVSSDAPGTGFMLTGTVLTFICLGAPLIASFEDIGASVEVMRYVPFALWPARTLLVVGAVKLLLSASPYRPLFSSD